MSYINKIQIDSNTAHLIEPTLFAAATANNNKTVYSATISNFEPVEGVVIYLKVDQGNAANAALSVNSGSNISIIYNGASITADTLISGMIYSFIYRIISNTSYWELTASYPGVINADITGNAATATDLATGSILSVGKGGTGLSSYNAYDILYASASDTLAKLNAGTAGTPLITQASTAAPKWYGGLILTGSSNSDYAAEFSGTISVAKTASISGNTTIGANGTASTLTVWGATTLKSTLDVNGNTTIGTSSSNKSLTVNGTLEVTSTSKLTGNVGIGAAADNTFKLYVEGNSKFKGNLVPQATNTYTLGESTTPLRWSALYIGTADTYGDEYTPVYWSNGVPTEVEIVKKYTFSFSSGATTTTVSPTNTNKAKSIVTEIVVDTGISYLNGEITWSVPTTGTDANKIVLTTTATSGTVSGYILVSIGS